MIKKYRTCDELGVCQGLGPEQCPTCESFECEVACPEPARPTYPFAPGTIDGPHSRAHTSYDDDSLLLLRDLFYVLVLCLLFAGAGGLLAGYLSRCWA